MKLTLKIKKNKKKHDTLDNPNVLKGIWDEEEDELLGSEIEIPEMKSKYDESQDKDLQILDSLLSYTKSREEKKKEKEAKKEKKKKKKKTKDGTLDISKLKIFEDEEFKDIVPQQTPVDKNSEDFYEARFNAPVIILKELLKQVNDFTVQSQQYLDEIKTPNAYRKISPMAVSSQMSNISNLFGTKLSIIKEITNINTKISDLELKKLKENNKANEGKDGAGGNVDENYLIYKAFGKLSEMEGPTYNDDFDTDNNKYTKDESDARIAERLKLLEEQGDLEFTDTEKAFKYEGKGIKIQIRKYPSNRWEFIAINQDDEEIYDYPLPVKKSVGRMKFDKEKPFAYDEIGNTYEVVYAS